MANAISADSPAPVTAPYNINNLPPRQKVAIFSGLMLAMFLAAMEQTIVATAMSTMANDLHGWGLMSWVVSAYLVSATAMTPVYGKLSDIYGRRTMLVIAIAVFAAASCLCALAQSMPQLIAARTIQGLGGGGLLSLSQTVIADIIPPRERGRYQGWFASVFATASVLGPGLGGLFVDYLSWHWIFWINLPLGLLALLVSNHALKSLTRPRQRRPIDWPGTLLLLASVTPVLIGVSQAEQGEGWGTPAVMLPIALGVLSLIGLIARERTAPEPILPPRLFTNPVVSVASVLSFQVAMVMIPVTILIPLDYQLAAGFSAKAAGTRLMALSGAVVAGALISGRGTARIGRYKGFAVAGAALVALVAALLAVAGIGRWLLFDLAAMVLLGCGIGLQLPAALVALQNALEPRDIGVGTSCVAFFRSMGGAFGVALLSTLLVQRMDAAVRGVPGHEILGDRPGLALFHLDHSAAALDPATLASFAGAIAGAFTDIYLAVAALGAVTAITALWLREIPLQTRVADQSALAVAE